MTIKVQLFPRKRLHRKTTTVTWARIVNIVDRRQIESNLVFKALFLECIQQIASTGNVMGIDIAPDRNIQQMRDFRNVV